MAAGNWVNVHNEWSRKLNVHNWFITTEYCNLQWITMATEFKMLIYYDWQGKLNVQS